MFSNLKALDSKLHRAHGWKRQDDYRFAAQHSLVPLVIGELSAVLSSYPIAFTRLSSGGFQLVAVQGLHEGENLYLDAEGKSRSGYVPSHYRGYPFALRDALIQGEHRAVLCFDFASGLYREAPDSSRGEERFFDDSGQVQPFLQQAIDFFLKVGESRKLTFEAVGALSAANLLVPWQLALENPDPQRPLQGGLYRVDEAAIGRVDGSILEVLRDAHALAVAYAQIFSQPRLGMLRKLYDLRAPQPALSDVDLDAVFGEGEGDSFQFDFG